MIKMFTKIWKWKSYWKLFCVKVELYQKLVFCRLKIIQNWISPDWKEQWLWNFTHDYKILWECRKQKQNYSNCSIFEDMTFKTSEFRKQWIGAPWKRGHHIEVDFSKFFYAILFTVMKVIYRPSFISFGSISWLL